MLIVTKQLKDWLCEHKGASQSDDESTLRGLAVAAFSSGELGVSEMRAMTKADLERQKKVEKAMRTQPSAAAVFGGSVEVETNGGYATTKALGKHARMGCEVLNERGQPAMLSSQREQAMTGVYLKTLAGRSGIPVNLSDHERELWNELLSEKSMWVGNVGGQWRDQIPGLQIKALLSDSVSGGLEVNPAFFDANVVTFPLLNGELFPLVDVREVPRGSSVEGASIGNPTLTWGTAEGTPISLFGTDDFVAEINTSIFPVTVAIEVGRDFLSDAAADVGRILEATIGQRLLAELDRVIANGNGTSEPTGIFNASGVTTVSSDNGSGGAITVGDFESLLFGIGKEYRQSPRCAFIANDVTYRRVRTIQVDPSSDARYVLGMELDRGSGAAIENYSVFGRRFRVNNEILNTRAFFGDLGRYRMYRRLGMQVQWHTSGDTLARRNTALLVCRARFGGRVMDASAFAKCTDLQS